MPDQTGSRTPRALTAREKSLCLILALWFVATSLVLFAGRPAPDLLSVWLAGVFHDSGNLSQVYAQSGGLFAVQPPAEWPAYAAGIGQQGAVHPFIYPPLWAVLVGWLTRVMGYETFALGMLVLNSALFAAMILTAWRASRPEMGPVAFVLIAMAVLLSTHSGALALLQNQVQIPVSFLIVLAIERSRSGAPMAAGAALALAASLKLYPVLFALVWLATGDRRAVTATAGFGLLLGGLSVALAGWPPHAAYLDELAAISATGLFSQVTFSVSALVTQLFHSDTATLISAVSATGGKDMGAMWVVPKSPLWVWFDRFALIGAAGAIAMCFRRAGPSRSMALWPLLVCVVSLLSPLAWPFHFLPAMVFMPMLVVWFGKLWGGVLLCATTLPILFLLAPLWQGAGGYSEPFAIVGTLAMAALALAYAVAAARQS